MCKSSIPFVAVLLLNACSLFEPEKEPEPVRAFDISLHWEFANRPAYGVSVLPSDYAFGGAEGIYVLGSNRPTLVSSHISKESSRFKRIGSTTYANAQGIRLISRGHFESLWTVTAESDVAFGAFHVLTSGRVVIGIEGGIRYKDSGSSDWVDVPIPIPNGVTPMRVNVFLQASNGTLFAGTHDGVYRSMDQGQTWGKVTQSIHKDVDNFHALYEEHDGTLLAIFGNKHHASSDNGSTWSTRTIPGGGGGIFRDGNREFSVIGGDLYFRNIGELEFRSTELEAHLRKTLGKHVGFNYVDVRWNRVIIQLSYDPLIVATLNPDWEGWAD